MGIFISLVVDNICDCCNGTGKYPSYRKCYECHGTGEYYSFRKMFLNFNKRRKWLR